MIKDDEFVLNESYHILTGGNLMGLQHIADENGPICGVRITNANVFDLFSRAHLCWRCEEKYIMLAALEELT